MLGWDRHAARTAVTGTATAAAVAACIALSATPAQAVPVSPWPAGGRTPTGCVTETPAGSGTGTTWTYTDTFVPLVPYAGFSASIYTTVGPMGRRIQFSARTLQPCSGVGSVEITTAIGNGPFSSAGPTTAVTDNAFDATWVTPLRTVLPSDAGRYVTKVSTMRRYDAFILDVDHRLVSATPTAAPAEDISGGWATVSQFLLRQTTLTSAVSRSVVATGGSVTVSGYLNYALDRAWARDNGETVVVLTRTPGHAWVKRATLVADSHGHVSWTFRPTAARTYVSLVHGRVFSGRYTAASISPTRVVLVRR